MVENINSANNKVFFIISNLSILNTSMSYSLSKSKGIINFTEVLKISNNKIANYTTYVYYFEIDQKYFRKKKSNEFYEAKIILKYNKLLFEEIIRFKKDKNTFIYNFSFNMDTKKQQVSPNFVNYSKVEQFQIFKNALIKLNIETQGKISEDLITDSIGIMNEFEFYEFDYYLEILKSIISQEEALLLLKKFNVKRIKYISNMKIQEYSSFLEEVEKDPDIILCHCKKTDSRNEYLEKFYTLLLFFYNKLKEEKKIKELLKKQEFRNIFLKIIDNFYR